MDNLLEKYNRSGPRYTSYPPHPFWKNRPSESQWIEHIKKNYDEKKGIDLYLHIPFCEKLCYYCGCNRIITKNKSVQEEFVGLLLKEWEIYLNALSFIPTINSIHFGGGTPTFLTPENFEKIVTTIVQRNTLNFKGSIEIDPRNTTLEHLDVFQRMGIGRISMGIQDFDPGVQKAINRHQSFEMVEELVNEMRKREFESINFDVIYGLPKQTKETIAETFRLIRNLRPDLIAYYSYAHLPDKLKNQRLIRNEDLLLGQDKLSLYELGKELLALDGYVDVGMDHFALNHSFLYQAKKNHKLHRNFMGYVDKKSGILIGLGPSAISDSSLSFMQNEKVLSEYGMRIKKGELAFSHGHLHDEEDLKVQKIILELMCQNESEISKSDKIPYWEEVQRDLLEMQEDGMLKFDGKKIIILDRGKRFVRNIAMTFDFYFREKMPIGKFSQTI